MKTSKKTPISGNKQASSLPKAAKASTRESTPKSAGKLLKSAKKATAKKTAKTKSVAKKTAAKKPAVAAKVAENKKPTKNAVGKVLKQDKSGKSVATKPNPPTKAAGGLSERKGKIASNKPSAKLSPAKAGLKSPISSTKSAKEKSPALSIKPPMVAQKPIVTKKAAEVIPPPSNTKPEIVAKIRLAQAEKELRKDLAQPAPKVSLTPLTLIPSTVKGKDRMILMVRDPYWLHAHWDITRQSVDRAKASLAEHWHTIKPILRLLKMDNSGTTSNAETVFRDIEIHGGVRNWYIEVDSPPSRFRMLMGYLSANNRFYELARSNTVTTPVPGGKETSDDHWADISKDAEHIYSMSGGYGDDTQTGDLTEVFQERLKRTMDSDVLSQFGSGAEGSLKRHKHFHFDVDAELIVFGSTHPEAHVSVGTEPVKVRNDGSFSIRLPLPDRRQVLPATAKSRDGVDEQTVVIAVERNTKVMEPLSLDTDDL